MYFVQYVKFDKLDIINEFQIRRIQPHMDGSSHVKMMKE